MSNLRWVWSSPAGVWREGKPERVSGRVDVGLEFSGRRDQVWEGFGGCFNELGWDALCGLPQTRREQVLKALFDPNCECRFTRCRVPIGASDYARDWYSLNEHSGDFGMRRFSIERDRECLIRYIKAALRYQPNLRLFASPWSPPTWLKRPAVYNYGTLIWEPKYLRAYALYLARFVEEYGKAGVTVDQVHVQNEPLADQKFPSCLWTGPQMRDFIRDWLGPVFHRRRLQCEIWLGTLNTDDYHGFVRTVLSDPGAATFVAGVGFQWAGKGAIQRTHESWPALPLMQTENECGDGNNTWEYAHYVFDLMRHYITNGACAYVYWNMVLPPGGRSSWGWPQNAMVTADPATGKVIRNPEFFVMKHSSHFVRPGAVRLGLAGPWTGNAYAFENPDGTRVVVANNPSRETAAVVVRFGRTPLLCGLPPQSVSTFILRQEGAVS